MKLTITRKDGPCDGRPIAVESVSADDLPVFKMTNSDGVMCLGVKWSGCHKTYDSVHYSFGIVGLSQDLTPEQVCAINDLPKPRSLREMIKIVRK